jgi:hypothetical protein
LDQAVALGALIDKRKARIDQAVGAYIARLSRQPHPSARRDQFLLLRRGSRGDKRSDGRQGWIKFGEPATRTALKERRAVQPVAGRLVLFPSYTWYGTIPFAEKSVRTTIAFDVVPR